MKTAKKGASSSVLLAAVLVTSACSLLYMLNNGVRVNFGLIASAIQAQTGLSPENTSTAIAVAQLLYGLSQPFFGILALKRSNSFVLALGAALMAAGLLLIPVSTTPAMLYLSLGILIGLAAGALAFGVVMGAAAPALSEKYAATASGIINGSGGLGGAILAPILQAFQDSGLFTLSMAVLAGIAGCGIVVSFWLGKRENLSSVGASRQDDTPSAASLLKEAFSSSRFLHLALAFFTCGFFMAIIETYLYPQLISYGFDSTEVAFLFTVYGVMGMVGPVISGFLSGKMNPKWVLGTAYGLRPVFIILFLLLPKTRAAVYLFVIGLGLIGNSTVPPTTILILKFFGNRKMPTLSGIAMVFHQIGSAVSTVLSARLIAGSGDYSYTWLSGAIVAAVAAVLCYTIQEKKGV